MDAKVTMVLSKSELLTDLVALRRLCQEYRALLERAWEDDAPNADARRLMTAHRELARASSGPFEVLSAVGGLLEFVVGRLRHSRVTFHLPRQAPAPPEPDGPKLAELAGHLRLVMPPLEALASRVYALARAARGSSQPRVQRVLYPCASLFKAIVRQDWRDAELVLNHINMVTTSRDNHDLVEQVGRLVRTIYNSLQEISAEVPLDMLSEVSEELPDAADKLHSVIRELENGANRNLDMLENLSGGTNAGRALVETGQEAVAGTLQELSALAQAHPEAAEQLQAVAASLQAQVAEPLTRVAERMQETHEVYMTLFANQSFQDLTGQTLKKVIAFIEGLQYQLIQVISKDDRPATSAPHRSRDTSAEAGPDAGNRLSQENVDAVLAELGF